MADLLEQAAGWLGGMRAAHLSRSVTYSRPSTGSGQGAQVQVAATVGRTTFEIDDGYGVVEKWESRDFLIAAADLVLGDATATPQRGDRIADGGKVYEVMAPGKEDCFRKSDPYGVTLRIHTKQVE